jgi:hypothetical protein
MLMGTGCLSPVVMAFFSVLMVMFYCCGMFIPLFPTVDKKTGKDKHTCNDYY